MNEDLVGAFMLNNQESSGKLKEKEIEFPVETEEGREIREIFFLKKEKMANENQSAGKETNLKMRKKKLYSSELRK